MSKTVRKSDFYFELPQKSIPKYPLEERDGSKLLVYKQGSTNLSRFNQLASFLESDDLLVFNNAKVIPARMHFKRQSGARIEVLLLKPLNPSNYEEVFHSKAAVVWECIIGNSKKWKENEEIYLEGEDFSLKARLINRENRSVELSWEQNIDFLSLLDKVGKLPIPPYLQRDTEESDYQQYQTIYASREGSVAAPTAGLHFTNELMDQLAIQGIKDTELTLHVGAGTFLPVKEENVLNHQMHNERFSIGLESLVQLREAHRRISVGTTSLRVLESLYYCGLRLQRNESAPFVIGKLEPYQSSSELSYEESLDLIIQHLRKEGQEVFHASTEIMILPHYEIKSIKGLITNFHLPESTLLMLVAAVVGESWKEIYQTALDNDFRFLSYGDSSLLLMEQKTSD